MQNQCDKLGSLTFAPEHLPPDRAGVVREIERFRRRMRERHPEAVMVFTIEGDPGVEFGGEDGKRLHIHFAYNRYLPKGDVERAWGRGFVELRRIRVAEGQRFGEVGTGKRAGARRAAGYLAKYVTKEFSAGAGGRSLGGRRFMPPKGYAVRFVRRRLSELPEALSWIQERTGGLVEGTWSSVGDEDWRGPPCWSWEFGDP